MNQRENDKGGRKSTKASEQAEAQNIWLCHQQFVHISATTNLQGTLQVIVMPLQKPLQVINIQHVHLNHRNMPRVSAAPHLY